jgi:hypothetical protein
MGVELGARLLAGSASKEESLSFGGRIELHAPPRDPKEIAAVGFIVAPRLNGNRRQDARRAEIFTGVPDAANGGQRFARNIGIELKIEAQLVAHALATGLERIVKRAELARGPRYG